MKPEGPASLRALGPRTRRGGAALGLRTRRGRAALVALGLSACTLDNPGVALPEGTIAYPIGIALSPEVNDDGAPRFLYVANANFDLRYNAGSLQSYDLDALAAYVHDQRCRCDEESDSCQSRGVPTATPSEGRTVEAGVVDALPLDAGESDAGESDAGESDAGESDAGESDAGESDAGESDAGESDAGAASAEVQFSDGYDAPLVYGNVRGTLCDGRDAPEDTVCCLDDRDALDPLRVSEIVTDSYANGLALSSDGARLYVPLRSRNRLLYVDVADGVFSCGSTPADERCTRGPDLSDEAASGASPAAQATAIVSGDAAGLGVSGVEGTFIATSHGRGQLSLFIDDGRGPRLADVLTRADTTVRDTRAMNVSFDASRGLFMLNPITARFVDQIAPVERDGVLRLARSAALSLPGLAQATDVRSVIADPDQPGALFALVRGPSTSQQQAVAFVQIDSSDPQGARLVDAVRIGAGAVRLSLVTLGGRRLLFAACYDGRAVFVIDADQHELVTVIREFNGPYEMVFDPVRALMYVSDFKVSAIRVVDIGGLIDRSRPPPRIVATLGKLYFGGNLK
jgi:DNA-binding beta-propeller fold protein YncE